MGVAALVCGALAWLLLAGPVQIAYPEGNAGFYAVLALTCLLIGAAVLAIFRVLVIRYWPMTSGQRQDLATRTLMHYTTREAAAKIMGMATIPAAGLTGTDALLTGQPGALTAITALTGGRAAVSAAPTCPTPALCAGTPTEPCASPAATTGRPPPASSRRTDPPQGRSRHSGCTTSGRTPHSAITGPAAPAGRAPTSPDPGTCCRR